MCFDFSGFWVPAFLGRPPLGSGAEAPNPEIPAPPVWLKKPHGGLRNLVSVGSAAKERKHAGGGGDARRRLLRAAQRVGVRVCVAGARDGRAMGCCTRRRADAHAAGSQWRAVSMKVCAAPRNARKEEECGDVRAPRAPRSSWAGGSGQCARRALGGARVEAGGVTDRARHGLLGATPLGLASPMGELFFKVCLAWRVRACSARVAVSLRVSVSRRVVR